MRTLVGRSALVPHHSSPERADYTVRSVEHDFGIVLCRPTLMCEPSRQIPRRLGNRLQVSSNVTVAHWRSSSTIRRHQPASEHPHWRVPSRGRYGEPYCSIDSSQINAFSPLTDRPQAGFGLHASHTSVAASRVITSGKIGLYSALVKHKMVPRPTVHVMMRAP